MTKCAGVGGRWRPVVDFDGTSVHRFLADPRPATWEGARVQMQVEAALGRRNIAGPIMFTMMSTLVLPTAVKLTVETACMFDRVQETFPELAHLARWHWCSADGPPRYPDWPLELAASARNRWRGSQRPKYLGFLRRVAVWPEATDGELLTRHPDKLRAALLARLPELQEGFRRDVAGAGFPVMW